MRSLLFLSAASLCLFAAACGDGSSIDARQAKGGTAPSASTNHFAEISGIANAATLDADFLYLALQDNLRPRIVRVSKADGSISDVTTTGAFVLGMCADDAFLYYTTLDSGGDVHVPSGTVSRVAKSGGAPDVLASGQYRPWGIACGKSDLYWANQGMEIGEASVATMPKSGGAVTVLVSEETQTEEVALVDDQTIAWGNGPYSPVDGAVKTMSLAPGSSPLTLTGPVGFVRSLAASDRFLAWIGDDTLNVYSFADGTTTSRVIGQQESAALDGDNVYWGLDNQDETRGTVEKLPANASAPMTILPALSEPEGLVTSGWMTALLFDGRSIYAIDYFAQYSDGMHTTIRRAGK